MKTIYYYDSRRTEGDVPTVPLSDRSLFFGDAIYDACLVRNKIPYLLDRHLDRFFSGCEALSIRTQKSRTELSDLILSLCEEVCCEVAFLYFQASRSAPVRRHFSTNEDGSHLLISISEARMPRQDETLSLIFEKDRRYEFCNVKTTNLIPAVLAATRAKAANADEAVFVRNGAVTECAHSNVSILKAGILYTHPKGRLILPGIARERLILTCETLKIPVLEQPFSPADLLKADEVFVTSTTKLCLRASSIMGRPIGMKDEIRANSIQNAIFSHFICCDNAQ